MLELFRFEISENVRHSVLFLFLSSEKRFRVAFVLYDSLYLQRRQAIFSSFFFFFFWIGSEHFEKSLGCKKVHWLERFWNRILCCAGIQH